jgi:hypothetical protein
MGALTYFFAHLGASPLEVGDAPLDLPVPAPAPVPLSVPDLAPAVPPAAAPAVTVPQQDVLQSETKSEAERPVARANEPERPREARAPSREREAAPNIESRAPRAEPAPRLQFPEFTDSSRPVGQERAADGPRIDSLFERRAESGPPGPTTAQPDSEREAPATVSSCENAIARNNEQISIGGPRGPADITREAYAGILQNGGYLSGCSIPERTVFEICAAVRDGRAVGVTVTSSPASPSLNACVRRAVSRLKFPHNPRLDVTHTRFDAVRR